MSEIGREAGPPRDKDDGSVLGEFFGTLFSVSVLGWLILPPITLIFGVIIHILSFVAALFIAAVIGISTIIFGVSSLIISVVKRFRTALPPRPETD